MRGSVINDGQGALAAFRVRRLPDSVDAPRHFRRSRAFRHAAVVGAWLSFHDARVLTLHIILLAALSLVTAVLSRHVDHANFTVDALTFIMISVLLRSSEERVDVLLDN